MLRLMLRKYALSPLTNGGPHARVSSPRPGCSILMTRAPMSASSIVQYGPDSTRVKSTTVNAGERRGVSRHRIEGWLGDHRIHRIALTQLRPGERVSFTRRADVHRPERRRRRRGVRRAYRDGLPRRSGDDHQRPRRSKDSTSRRCGQALCRRRIVTRSLSSAYAVCVRFPSS